MDSTLKKTLLIAASLGFVCCPLTVLGLPEVAARPSEPPPGAETPEMQAQAAPSELPILDQTDPRDTRGLPASANEGATAAASEDWNTTGSPTQAGGDAGTPEPTAFADVVMADPTEQSQLVPSAAVAATTEPSGVVVPKPLAALLAAGVAAMLLLGAIALLNRREPAAMRTRNEQIPRAFLNDLGGATDNPSYELGESLTVVGRVKGGDADRINYVTIAEPTIGRRHALIEFKNHCFWVADQDSLNGTFINDKRIEGDARLKHGDRIRFHIHEFEFLLLDMFETDITMVGQENVSELSPSIDASAPTKPLASAASKEPVRAQGRE